MFPSPRSSTTLSSVWPSAHWFHSISLCSQWDPRDGASPHSYDPGDRGPPGGRVCPGLPLSGETGFQNIFSLNSLSLSLVVLIYRDFNCPSCFFPPVLHFGSVMRMGYVLSSPSLISLFSSSTRIHQSPLSLHPSLSGPDWDGGGSSPEGQPEQELL